MGTAPSRSSKRRLDDDASQQSRRKKIAMAVDEVEAALSRLREVTSSISGPEIACSVDHSPAPETGNGVNEIDLNELEHSNLDAPAVVSEVDVSDLSQQACPETPWSIGCQGEKHRNLEKAELDLIQLLKCFEHRGESTSSQESESDGTGLSEMALDDKSTDLTEDSGGEEGFDSGDYRTRRDGDSMSETGEEESDNEKNFEVSGNTKRGDQKPSETTEVTSIADSCGEYTRRRSCCATPEIPLQLTSTETSPPSRDDTNDFSPTYRRPSPEIDCYRQAPSFQASPSASPSRKTPPPITAIEYQLPSNRVETIKVESPPFYPLLSDSNSFRSPPRPIFAAEIFPTFITPRSPARQARLEAQTKIQRLLDDPFKKEEIYVPKLTSISSELSPQQLFPEAEVSDARVVEWGDKDTVRLVRVAAGEGT